MAIAPSPTPSVPRRSTSGVDCERMIASSRQMACSSVTSATHQAPGDNIAQFPGLILIELLAGLYQRRDHQAGIFHVLAGDAGEGDGGGHLTGKVRRPGGAGER